MPIASQLDQDPAKANPCPVATTSEANPETSSKTNLGTEPRYESRCPASPRAKWAARIGAYAFLFFLVKGLLWLIVPALAYLAIR